MIHLALSIWSFLYLISIALPVAFLLFEFVYVAWRWILAVLLSLVGLIMVIAETSPQYTDMHFYGWVSLIVSALALVRLIQNWRVNR